jgi:adenine-specific DNA-methyltransferase
MVTNNEISEAERKDFESHGVKEGSDEWNSRGIARYVTWPRTVCSIEGHDINGSPLKGNYLVKDIPMADGFKTNAAFFKLGFLDKNDVALGKQFKELVPVLWMKAGAIGECPFVTEDIPNMLVLPKNKFAVLTDERCFMEFVEELDKHPEIETVYIVTDSERAYRDMIAFMDGKNTYQLYRDYLDNFRINSVRR